MKLSVLPQKLSVCRLDAKALVVIQPSYFSITRTDEELSVVCNVGQEPNGAKVEGPWRALKVEGPLDFALTGVLSQILEPLAQAKISIFAVSTFDTDYVLVKSALLEPAKLALIGAGHQFT